jgi:hypothetical protein
MTKRAFAEINRIENTIEAELETYRQLNPDYGFEIHPLQEADQGITEREIEDVGNEKSLGTHGHATRYYAIFVVSKKVPPPSPRSIAELRAASTE